MVAAGWSEAQKRAYTLADNKLTLNGGWDFELLKLEVADLSAIGFDVPLIGFSQDELRAMSSGLIDPDQTPDDTPEEVVSKPGDVWLLGDHRLACGNSTEADIVAKVLNGASPHLMVTDPLYGTSYDASWRNRVHRADGSLVGGLAVGKISNDDRDWRAAWALFSGDTAYVWNAALHSASVVDSLVAVNFDARAQIVWSKSNFAIGRGDYHWQHELCWYVVRKGQPGHCNGDRTQTTVWEIPKPQRSETGHSAQKPVECMRRPILNNSKTGHGIYDPFSGSGTTIIAAEMTGRRCYAVEIDPAYVDVAVKRWQEFTGRMATLEGTGESFAEVVARRSLLKVEAAE